MSWLQDIRFAFRMIAKNPWFSAAIVVTLALGMGVNTTVFSLVNAVLYKPLPFPGGDRLVMISAESPKRGQERVPVSYADFRDFRQGSQSFERMEAISRMGVTLGEQGNPPQRYSGARITSGMFDMLRTQPVLGRNLRPADEKAGAEPAILIGYGLWSDRYGRKPDVIGRAVRVNEKPATIVGVMPEGFKFPNNEDLWMAAIPDARAEKRDQRDYQMIGMLKPGVSVGEAETELRVIARRLEKTYPDTNKDYSAGIRTFHQAMNGGSIRLAFLLMLGAVGFVLLIACANVANMLLSRALERAREVSIRAAMGASRWQLIRQLLIESILLSALGGGVGLVLARFAITAFGRAVQDVGKPYWVDFSMDYTVFGYFAALIILAGIIFGLAPAVSASRVNLHETLKEGSRSSDGVRGGYLSGGLVVLQFSLAVVLLSGAGLMARSFLRAQDEFSWVRGEQVLHARISIPESRYAKPVERQQFYDALQQKLATMPGARQVAITSNIPGTGSWSRRFEIQGKSVADPQRRPTLGSITVGKGYYSLLGLNMLRGRDFNDTDGLEGKEAVIVTQNFVARHFPNQDPIGQQIRIYDDDRKAKPWMTIIGIAPDLRQDNPSDERRDPLVLLPHKMENYNGMAVLVRAHGDSTTIATDVRGVVNQLDQDLPLFDVASMNERFERQRWYLRVFGTVFLSFAIIALGMAAVGIYAVMAQATARRTREIGVRMALGAGVGAILRLVLGRGVKQLAAGVVIGLAAALFVCRLMATILFNVAPNDPATFSVVVLALGSVGLMAVWLPARRAARLDPLKALRHE